jgi:hypothetical protein
MANEVNIFRTEDFEKTVAFPRAIAEHANKLLPERLVKYYGNTHDGVLSLECRTYNANVFVLGLPPQPIVKETAKVETMVDVSPTSFFFPIPKEFDGKRVKVTVELP